MRNPTEPSRDAHDVFERCKVALLLALHARETGSHISVSTVRGKIDEVSGLGEDTDRLLCFAALGALDGQIVVKAGELLRATLVDDEDGLGLRLLVAYP